MLTPWKALGTPWFVVWVISGVVLVSSFIVFGKLTITVLTKMPVKTAEGTAGSGPPPPPAPTITQTPSAPAVQTAVAGNTAGRDIKITNNNVIKVEALTRFDDTIQLAVADLNLRSELGKRSDVKVYLLWRDASWTKREATLSGEKKFLKFLTGDVMREAFDGAEFIGCIGLASNEMTPELANAPSQQKEKVLGGLTDRRAARLCEYVATAARELKSKARFVGLGIGYNQARPVTEDGGEIKQRASVLVRVNRKSGEVLTKDDIHAIIAEIVKTAELQGFRPADYSRVSEKRPFCWVSMEQGTFNWRDLKCD